MPSESCGSHAPEALKSILDALPEKRVYRFVSGAVLVCALGNPRTELAAIGAAPLQWKITGNGQISGKPQL